MNHAIFLALFASVSVAFSMYFQKTALNSLGSFSARKMILSPRWIFGAVLGILSFTTYIWALSLEKVSLIQPIIDSSVIFSIIISHLFLNDRVARNEVVSVILVTIGMLLLVT